MRKKANTLYDEDLQVDGIQGQQNKLVGEAKAYVAREQDQGNNTTKRHKNNLTILLLSKLQYMTTNTMNQVTKPLMYQLA